LPQTASKSAKGHDDLFKNKTVFEVFDSNEELKIFFYHFRSDSGYFYRKLWRTSQFHIWWTRESFHNIFNYIRLWSDWIFNSSLYN